MAVFAPTVPRDWLVVAARAPYAASTGGYAWQPRLPDEWPALAQFDPAVAAVRGLIAALPELYGADGAGIHLVGFSQGAATAYAAAMRHPGLVRGIAGLVGFAPTVGDDVRAARPLAELPVFMAVGRRDAAIPIERSLACAETLRAAGADLTYNTYDTGHKLSAQGMRDLAAWWRRIEPPRGAPSG